MKYFVIVRVIVEYYTVCENFSNVLFTGQPNFFQKFSLIYNFDILRCLICTSLAICILHAFGVLYAH